MKRKIINLSTYNFKKDQINLLRLGLKFCPNPKSNIGELNKDPRILNKMWGNRKKNKRDTGDSLVNNKTKFLPDKNNNGELNTFSEKLWSINLKISHKTKNKP